MTCIVLPSFSVYIIFLVLLVWKSGSGGGGVYPLAARLLISLLLPRLWNLRRK